MNAFPDNARVCFLGDSITANGRFVALIHDCFKRNHPHCGIRFFDCGTSGGSAEWLLRTFDEDIAPHKPTHVFLMIGINDSRRDLLAQPRTPERSCALLEAYETYKTNLRTLIARLQALGTQVTLVSLPPCAEFQPGDSPNLPGSYALTLGYAAAMQAIALECGCGFTDLHAFMTEKMQTEDLYAPDRVHPTPKGHLYMAEAILQDQGLTPASGAEEEHISALQEKLLDFRRIMAVEYLVINDETLSDEEKLARVRQYLEEKQWARPNVMNFREVSERYLVTKPIEREYAAEIEALLTV